MLLVLDNYDSFTFNLVHYLHALTDEEITVRRNDHISLDDVSMFDSIVISPGPGLPVNAGITLDLIRRYYQEKKILGVCLGQQAIIEAFGGKLKNLDKVLHGISCTTRIVAEDDLFKGLPNVIDTGHYHSWVVCEPLPPAFKVTARSESGEVMAISHDQLRLKGVQFHPESILTPEGKKILENWLALA